MDDKSQTTSEETQEQLPLDETTVVEESASGVKAEGATQGTAGAVKEESVGAVVPPKARVYSEAEWNKRQSAIDRQMNEVTRQIQETVRAREELETRLEEERSRQFLTQVESQGGDLELAKRIIQREREASQKIRDVDRKAAALAAKEADLNAAGIGAAAYSLMKEYKLPDTVLEELLKSESKPEMEVRALKLHIEQLKVEKRPATRVETGPQTPKGVDWSKLSESEKFAKAIELTQKRK